VATVFFNTCGRDVGSGEVDNRKGRADGTALSLRGVLQHGATPHMGTLGWITS